MLSGLMGTLDELWDQMLLDGKVGRVVGSCRGVDDERLVCIIRTYGLRQKVSVSDCLAEHEMIRISYSTRVIYRTCC